MKQAFAILGMVFIFVSGAAAQEHPAIERLLTTTYFTLAPTSDAASSTLPLAVAPSMLSSSSGAPSPGTVAPATFSFAANAPSATAPADPPQYVQGVHVIYNWQAYFGYTFFRFYEAPGTQRDTNGFNYSMVYYFKNWFGLDGEFAATKTSQNAFNGWFLFGGGGPRFRWSGPRGLELWGHVLFGYSSRWRSRHQHPAHPLGPALRGGHGGLALLQHLSVQPESFRRHRVQVLDEADEHLTRSKNSPGGRKTACYSAFLSTGSSGYCRRSVGRVFSRQRSARVDHGPRAASSCKSCRKIIVATFRLHISSNAGDKLRCVRANLSLETCGVVSGGNMKAEQNEVKIVLQVGSELRIKNNGDIIIDNPELELVRDESAADAVLLYRFDPKAGQHILRLQDPVANHQHLKVHRRGD